FFPREDGIRVFHVRSSDVCSSDLATQMPAPIRATLPMERKREPHTIPAPIRFRTSGSIPIASTPTARPPPPCAASASPSPTLRRSEEHTSELQSRENLVCRLLLEK